MNFLPQDSLAILELSIKKGHQRGEVWLVCVARCVRDKIGKRWRWKWKHRQGGWDWNPRWLALLLDLTWISLSPICVSSLREHDAVRASCLFICPLFRLWKWTSFFHANWLERSTTPIRSGSLSPNLDSKLWLWWPSLSAASISASDTCLVLSVWPTSLAASRSIREGIYELSLEPAINSSFCFLPRHLMWECVCVCVNWSLHLTLTQVGWLLFPPSLSLFIHNELNEMHATGC